MELFIEKEFLDDFYLDYNDSQIQQIVKKIISLYGDKKVYINYDINDFEKLKKENEFFALINNTTVPIPLENIYESLKLSDFKQTLVFTNNKMEWFEELEIRGALCFSFDNYEEKISEIIHKLHFKVDLSEEFSGWGFLQDFKNLNFNSIVISDRYILADKDNQKINENIIPLLQKMILNVEREMSIKIFTRDLNPIKDTDKYKKEKAKKRYRILNSVFTKYKTKFSIILNDFPITDHKLHDRYISTNFGLIDCGVGFNLMPYKRSDSQIISETIFEMYTYKRLNNIKKVQTEYVKKLQNLDTIKFKMYPE